MQPLGGKADDLRRLNYHFDVHLSHGIAEGGPNFYATGFYSTFSKKKKKKKDKKKVEHKNMKFKNSS
jgi:hypothetical protein